jgi:hypothetical protein
MTGRLGKPTACAQGEIGTGTRRAPWAVPEEYETVGEAAGVSGLSFRRPDLQGVLNTAALILD